MPFFLVFYKINFIFDNICMISKMLFQYLIESVLMYKNRVIQKSGRNLKVNNSKTNTDKMMRFAPNGWILYGNKK